MKEIGLDEWYWKMEEHQRKGHRISHYGATAVRNTADDFEKRLFLKEQRIKFWELNRRVPTADELMWNRMEAKT